MLRWIEVLSQPDYHYPRTVLENIIIKVGNDPDVEEQYEMNRVVLENISDVPRFPSFQVQTKGAFSTAFNPVAFLVNDQAFKSSAYQYAGGIN